MATPGQSGLSVQQRRFSAALEGQFGISVQLGANTLIEVYDQRGLRVRGVNMKIDYVDNGTPVNEPVFVYDYNRPVNRSFPEVTNISVVVTGAGISDFAGVFQVPLQAQVTYRVVVNRFATTRIIHRRRVF